VILLTTVAGKNRPRTYEGLSQVEVYADIGAYKFIYIGEFIHWSGLWAEPASGATRGSSPLLLQRVRAVAF